MDPKTIWISPEKYIESINEFIEQIKLIHANRCFDAIVAPKRSGLFIGVMLSHSIHLPLFTPTEFKLQIKTLPFKNLLVCDTAVFKGRTFRKIKTKLAPCSCFCAAIWQERYGDADYVLYNPKHRVKFFYER
jgi:hypothetical protein